MMDNATQKPMSERPSDKDATVSALGFGPRSNVSTTQSDVLVQSATCCNINGHVRMTIAALAKYYTPAYTDDSLSDRLCI